MIDKEKQLLLKDLCGRLPYGVKVLYEGQVKEVQYIEPLYNELKLLEDFSNYTIGIEEIKPYLRPISSMTEDEMDRLFEILHIDENNDETDWIKITWGNDIKFFFPSGRYAEDVAKAFDYLNSIHIDYRGLIPKGLAIEAPEGVYKEAEK